MPKSNAKIGINLSSSRSQDSIEKIFFRWALNVGRIIIITTELIALAALSYRFMIDKQIVDLHDNIKRQEEFIKSQTDNEKKYRDLQGRLSYVKTITTETQAKINVLNKIIETVKNGVLTTTNLIVTTNTISINGDSASVFAINNFIESMKEDPNVTAMSVDEITSTNQGIRFKVTITLTESTIVKNERK